MAEQGHEDRVQAQAQAPQHVHFDLHVAAGFAQFRHQQRAQHHQRLGADDRDEPAAVDDVDVALVGQEGEHGERQVEQQAPGQEGERPQCLRQQWQPGLHRQHAEQVAGRDQGEEAEHQRRIQQVLADRAWGQEHPQQAEHQQQHVGDRRE